MFQLCAFLSDWWDTTRTSVSCFHSDFEVKYIDKVCDGNNWWDVKGTIELRPDGFQWQGNPDSTECLDHVELLMNMSGCINEDRRSIIAADVLCALHDGNRAPLLDLIGAHVADAAGLPWADNDGAAVAQARVLQQVRQSYAEEKVNSGYALSLARLYHTANHYSVFPFSRHLISPYTWVAFDLRDQPSEDVEAIQLLSFAMIHV